MKPAKPRHKSDCVAASLATVFEEPIESMPDFWGDDDETCGVRQYDMVSKWLAVRGFHWYYASCRARQFANFQKGRTPADESWPPRGYWFAQIAQVETLIENEPKHMVVMRNRKCVFNPSASIAKTKEDDVFLVGYYLLVALDPAGKS